MIFFHYTEFEESAIVVSPFILPCLSLHLTVNLQQIEHVFKVRIMLTT